MVQRELEDELHALRVHTYTKIHYMDVSGERVAMGNESVALQPTNIP